MQDHCEDPIRTVKLEWTKKEKSTIRQWIIINDNKEH